MEENNHKSEYTQNTHSYNYLFYKYELYRWYNGRIITTTFLNTIWYHVEDPW